MIIDDETAEEIGRELLRLAASPDPGDDYSGDILESYGRIAFKLVAPKVLEMMREPSSAMVLAAIRATDEGLTDEQRDIGSLAIAHLPPLAPHRQRDGINAACEIVRDWQVMIDKLREDYGG